MILKPVFHTWFPNENHQRQKKVSTLNIKIAGMQRNQISKSFTVPVTSSAALSKAKSYIYIYVLYMHKQMDIYIYIYIYIYMHIFIYYT